jgi:hypothetical protein
MRARWKLGRALAKEERGPPGPAGKDTSRPATYFKDLLAKIGLQKDRAQEAQRIGTLPGPTEPLGFPRRRSFRLSRPLVRFCLVRLPGCGVAANVPAGFLLGF